MSPIASIWKNNLPLKVSTIQHFQKKCWKIPPFSGSIPKSSTNIFCAWPPHFYDPTPPKQKPPLPSHLLKSPGVTWQNNSKVRKLKKRNFWKYLHSPNSELWFLFHDIFKNIFSPPAKPYTQAAPNCFFPWGPWQAATQAAFHAWRPLSILGWHL